MCPKVINSQEIFLSWHSLDRRQRKRYCSRKINLPIHKCQRTYKETCDRGKFISQRFYSSSRSDQVDNQALLTIRDPTFRHSCLVFSTGVILTPTLFTHSLINVHWYKAANLAPVVGHLCGKFEVLTGECWVWSDMLTGLFSYDEKYIFTWEKQTRRWTMKIMAVTHFDLFSFTAHFSRLRPGSDAAPLMCRT